MVIIGSSIYLVRDYINKMYPKLGNILKFETPQDTGGTPANHNKLITPGKTVVKKKCFLN